MDHVEIEKVALGGGEVLGADANSPRVPVKPETRVVGFHPELQMLHNFRHLSLGTEDLGKRRRSFEACEHLGELVLPNFGASLDSEGLYPQLLLLRLSQIKRAELKKTYCHGEDWFTCALGRAESLTLSELRPGKGSGSI